MFITKYFRHPNKKLAILDWTLTALFVGWTIRKLRQKDSF